MKKSEAHELSAIRVNIRPMYECHRCAKRVNVIIKMGGLICEHCRVILFRPDTIEWKTLFNSQRMNRGNPKM